jgi:NAD(P)-dependent dehydrogenase (short-subunit alcohol dehydrogenase family)
MSASLRTLVIGGSGALGRAVTEALVSLRSRVVFTYRTGTAAAEQLCKKFDDVRGLTVHLTSVADVERVVDEAAGLLGGLDALIHCGAVCIAPGEHLPADSNQRMDDVGEAGWDLLLAVNTKSVFFGCRRAARHLRQSGGGNILLVGSINAVKPLPSPVHYAASKAALAGMTLAMSKELGPHNIRVNLITPGLLEAGIARSLPKHLNEEYLKHCSLKRVGGVGEIARVLAWFARSNTYVTGQNILVEGAL